jgi:hypothetical protein
MLPLLNREYDMSQIEFPQDYTILFIAPFYNRTGYGMGARALVEKWHQAGLPIRILSVDEVEDGIDDFDIRLLKLISPIKLLLFSTTYPHKNGSK